MSLYYYHRKNNELYLILRSAFTTFHSRLCTRGSTWNHSFLSTFPEEFRHETCTIFVYNQDNHKSILKNGKIYRFKWRSKNEVSFRENSRVTKIKKKKKEKKKHFPKGFLEIKFGSK